MRGGIIDLRMSSTRGFATPRQSGASRPNPSGSPRLAGVNWYGAHEDDGVVSGLERTHRRALAKTIASHGFNSVRLPFSLWMTEQTAPVPDEYLAANPDLSGSTPLQVYDASCRSRRR